MASSRNLRFGVCLPTIDLSLHSRSDDYANLAATAEKLGFHSIWATDRVFHDRVPVLDPLTTLSYVASQTRTVRLGTSVLVTPTRNPVMLAKALSTLDFLSGGRLILGMALGSSREEYRATNAFFERRVALFLKGLELMKNLWTGQKISYSEFWNLEGARMLPRPIQRPRPPIWFGGYGEAAQRRAGRLADGWLAGTRMTAPEFKRGWENVVESAKLHRRDHSKLVPAKLFYIDINKRKAASRKTLQSSLARFYSAYDVDAHAISGTADECHGRLGEFLEAGVRTFILLPVNQSVQQLERIADMLSLF